MNEYDFKCLFDALIFHPLRNPVLLNNYEFLRKDYNDSSKDNILNSESQLLESLNRISEDMRENNDSSIIKDSILNALKKLNNYLDVLSKYEENLFIRFSADSPAIPPNYMNQIWCFVLFRIIKNIHHLFI